MKASAIYSIESYIWQLYDAVLSINLLSGESFNYSSLQRKEPSLKFEMDKRPILFHIVALLLQIFLSIFYWKISAISSILAEGALIRTHFALLRQLHWDKMIRGNYHRLVICPHLSRLSKEDEVREADTTCRCTLMNGYPEGLMSSKQADEDGIYLRWQV